MLTKEEIEFLDTNGYLGPGQVLTAQEVEQVTVSIAELMRSEGRKCP